MECVACLPAQPTRALLSLLATMKRLSGVVEVSGVTALGACS
jgi:hypothetical protein